MLRGAVVSTKSAAAVLTLDGLNSWRTDSGLPASSAAALLRVDSPDRALECLHAAHVGRRRGACLGECALRSRCVAAAAAAAVATAPCTVDVVVDGAPTLADLHGQAVADGARDVKRRGAVGRRGTPGHRRRALRVSHAALRCKGPGRPRTRC